MNETRDMIIVGAGLSGLLTAWRCLDVNPKLRIEIIESSSRIGGTIHGRLISQMWLKR